MKLAGAYVNDNIYEQLVAHAASQNRTLAGQCRHLFDRFLKEQESASSKPAPAKNPAKKKGGAK